MKKTFKNGLKKSSIIYTIKNLNLDIENLIEELKDLGKDDDEYPIACPFSVEQILDRDFLG
jgi:hypothetical protein